MKEIIEKYPQLDELSLSQLADWVRTKHNLYAEIFYSMFHKKFSVNNYFVDVKKGKKVYPLGNVSEKFDLYEDALELALKEMFKLI